ncbi:MAG: nucleotidyltransferase domain-containing protein [Defluviitaleaceae bacterium]|nr:nucleotidyltransferase domain-containing protein [Defluviitaleaceae bacterium]
MYLFGSHARGDANDDSDIDFAVQIEGTNLVSDYFRFHSALEDIFNKTVDLVPLEGVHIPLTRFENHFAPEFEKEKVIIF